MKLANTALALAIATLSVAPAVNAADDQPLTMEELSEIVKQQGAKIRELEAGQEATAEAVEQGGGNLPAWISKTSLGGYGEVHYNNLEADEGDGRKDEVDVHRFVLFLSHQFSDTVRFFSELEVEHALSGGGDEASCEDQGAGGADFTCDVNGKPGEVELEQAYIEVDYAKNHAARTGVVLVPVGFLNETHEPDTFYGVERNNVEKNIIPTTWWEAGVFLNGEIAEGVSYDFAVHSGLQIDFEGGDYKIRSGRQKVAEAEARDLAYTGRIKYNNGEGLQLAATVQHQTDLSQSQGSIENIDATLIEVNAHYQVGDFALRALYAAWDLDDDVNDVKDGADEQEGFFIEPSYKINEQWGVFARYSEWDNTAGSSDDTETEQIDVGVNYWLKPNVVFKADYQDQSNDDDTKASDGFNLGVGWSF